MYAYLYNSLPLLPIASSFFFLNFLLFSFLLKVVQSVTALKIWWKLLGHLPKVRKYPHNVHCHFGGYRFSSPIRDTVPCFLPSCLCSDGSPLHTPYLPSPDNSVLVASWDATTSWSFRCFISGCSSYIAITSLVCPLSHFTLSPLFKHATCVFYQFQTRGRHTTYVSSLCGYHWVLPISGPQLCFMNNHQKKWLTKLWIYTRMSLSKIHLTITFTMQNSSLTNKWTVYHYKLIKVNHKGNTKCTWKYYKTHLHVFLGSSVSCYILGE